MLYENRRFLVQTIRFACPGVDSQPYDKALSDLEVEKKKKEISIRLVKVSSSQWPKVWLGQPLADEKKLIATLHVFWHSKVQVPVQKDLFLVYIFEQKFFNFCFYILYFIFIYLLHSISLNQFFSWQNQQIHSVMTDQWELFDWMKKRYYFHKVHCNITYVLMEFFEDLRFFAIEHFFKFSILLASVKALDKHF